MIEVNLYSIPTGEVSSRVGKCVARYRFDKESMGVTVENFVKGFLKDNLDKFEHGIGSAELTGLINSSSNFTRKDVITINYFLTQAGFTLKVYNVTDDEENPSGVPSGEVVEWNVIDHNFIQNDYPTAVKIIPAPGTGIPSILRQIVEKSGLFDEDKFAGLKNPFTELLNNLDRIKNISGEVNPAITSRIYQYLDEMGLEIFCATSED
jgi:hypothetical protein